MFLLIFVFVNSCDKIMGGLLKGQSMSGHCVEKCGGLLKGHFMTGHCVETYSISRTQMVNY